MLFLCRGYVLRRRLRLRADADLNRIDPDWLYNVLELRRTEIADRQIEPRFHLPVGVLGKTDCAGLGDTFQSCGDIDAVSHQIAVAFLNDVAEMDADTKFDSSFRRQARIALDHAALHLDSTAHGVDNAAKLDEGTVASALHDSAVMDGNGRVDQVTPQRTKPGQRTIFVGSRESAVADHVSRENRSYLSCFGHAALFRCLR